MDLKDVFLTPFFLFAILLIAWRIQRLSALSGLERFYFYAGLGVKLAGAIAFGLIYQFYFIFAGDTFGFFHESKALTAAFRENPLTALKLIITPAGSPDPSLLLYTTKMPSYNDIDSFFFIKIITLLNLLTWDTYSATALLLAAISFSGNWAIYRVFVQIYPTAHRPLTLATLFIPSVVFWGSGLLKDTLALASIGWLFYSMYYLCIRREKIIACVFVFIIALLVGGTLKPYLIISMLPLCLLWVVLVYKQKLQNKWLRLTAVPLLLTVCGAIVYFLPPLLGKEFAKYHVEELMQTIEKHHNYNTLPGQGSTYSLGKIRKDIWWLIEKAPAAINVALFRPYPWEVKNFMMVFASVESSLLLFLTLFVFYRVGILTSCRIIYNTPLLICSLLFALGLAYWTGISTYNFGALSRYRIPLLPFYVAALFMLMEEAKRRYATKL